jgi:hypothetical protein
MEHQNTPKADFWVCPKCSRKISIKLAECHYCRNSTKSADLPQSKTNTTFEKSISTFEQFIMFAFIIGFIYAVMSGIEKLFSSVEETHDKIFFASVILQAFVFGGFCSFIGNQKGRNAGNWFVLGFLFSIIALLALIAVPNEHKDN